MIPENAYGHARRLDWIRSHLLPGDTVAEVGCGTGAMITIPLARLGVRVRGLDTDAASVAFGRDLLRKAKLDPDILRLGELGSLGCSPDVIVLSEVLEHIPAPESAAFLGGLRQALRPGGRLLVTVPNGWGWFELESFLWFRLGLGPLLERLRVADAIRALKKQLVGPAIEGHYHMTPSTLSASPHVRRFTLRSIRRELERAGFRVVEARGSVLFAGPFSNLLFTGLRPAMALNLRLGRLLGPLAANYFLACRTAEPP
jgi:2-polyprenyl-3-methyl-5-hydroxy-6-metoxy-1,4-benzoquinol methylase